MRTLTWSLFTNPPVPGRALLVGALTVVFAVYHLALGAAIGVVVVTLLNELIGAGSLGHPHPVDTQVRPAPA
ncbi:hypothetical protein DMT42_34140 [Streptomyces actuosus]|uniref:Uncharacterized protein n=1 Tax=Streptomyces actuosus TaxID=1885 RepID=A0A2U9PAM7_STRAS|nr:hypothetical protein DMT42_34140 [Streptomyces actuosus]